ncbi:MAG: PAS domain S-box protein [Bryobacterales bacterium]|nr:PAS domain S-box protein [Bryobacterales bacterium]
MSPPSKLVDIHAPRRLRVLLADQGDSGRAIVRMLQEMEGFEAETHWVQTAGEARRLLRQTGYNACLFDFTLGGACGLGLLHEAISIGVSAPILILTDVTSPEVADRALREGAADYLDKSDLSAAALERAFRSALNRAVALRRWRRDEDSFLASARLFRSLFESAPDPVLLLNFEGEIVNSNPEAEHCFGYGHAMLAGHPVDLLIRHPTGHVLPVLLGAALETSRHGRRPLRGLNGRRRNGEEFLAEISLGPMDSPSSRLLIAVVRDISPQIQLERRLRRQFRELQEKNAKIEQASQAKSAFLANMSHELRTPLNCVIGFAQMLYDGKAGEMAGRQREFVGDILASSRHLMKLINDILDMTRVEHGKLTFHPQEARLEDVVDEAVELQQSVAAAKSIVLRAEVDASIGPVFLDPWRLAQVCNNYVSNALKFTPEGGSVTVRVRAEGGDFFRLEVVDTGIGIAPEDLPRLFVSFEQLQPGSAKKFQGTGLGLALTKGLVEAQGGRVEVRSEPGRGSVFAAILPRRCAPPLPKNSGGESGMQQGPAQGPESDTRQGLIESGGGAQPYQLVHVGARRERNGPSQWNSGQERQ